MWDLPSYAREIVEAAIRTTGYPLAVVEEEGLEYDSEVRMARPERPVHEVAFSPTFRSHYLHFVVSASYKIIRVWREPCSERYMPGHEASRRLPVSQERELAIRNPGLSASELEAVSMFVYRGTVRQLASMPMDLRVERELWTGCHAHRESQRGYIEQQIKDLEAHFSPEVAAHAPCEVYAAVSAMNVAMAEEGCGMAELQMPDVFRRTPDRSVGLKLVDHLRDIDTPGYPGDREVTNRWASELGMHDWFEWLAPE